MATATTTVSGLNFEELMKDVDAETRKQVEDGIVFYTNDADTSGTAEKGRADKLRTGYNLLVEYLVSKKLNELNPHQQLFLCTGAVADNLIVQTATGPKTIAMIPQDIFGALLKSFSAPAAVAFPVFSTLDKFTAIAKSEILPMSLGDDRKKALRNSPQDQKRAKEEWKRKMDQAKAELSSAATQADMYFPKVVGSFNEASVKNAKIALEMLKKVSAAWGKGDAANDQEKAIIKAFEGKLTDAGNGLVKWTDEILSNLNKLSEYGKLMVEKSQNITKSLNEIAKIDNAAPVVKAVGGPLFDGDAISNIKIDIDATNSVSVRAAESAANKVAFSSSRILLNKQFNEGENFNDRLCTPQTVSAALEKITKIHTNLFPKDFEGKYVAPLIMIEPLRNYVDWFEDRFIMSLVSGETAKRGPVVNFNPAEVQVLKLAGLFITKDNIYDYRGEVKVGTLMGDYMGKVEKNTKVKWTGQDKKFSMVSTQSMQDTASRGDAVDDYIDFITAVANGIAPNPKISKRKINILLKYVLFDQVEKNISNILRLVAQTEPGEAKDSIMFFAKENVDVAKEMIAASLKVDPQTSKMFSDNPDFAIARVFGRS